MMINPKTVLAFDLDGTLAPSKSSLPAAMGERLGELLETYQICIISGGNFNQFKTQLIEGLNIDTPKLARLHLMPTCGTQYYQYRDNAWQREYVDAFSDQEKARILTVLNDGIDTLGLREPTVYGETIEDRESQITFSALGQNIVKELGEKGIELKEQWDPDSLKKRALKNYIEPRLEGFSANIGGTTSVDITRKGVDKAYGIGRLIQALKISSSDIVFFGDRLELGGNDYPVKAMGIDSINVDGWRDTLKKLEIY